MNKKNVYKYCLLFLLGLLIFFNSFAQTQPIFKKINQLDGLSNGRINSIVQEKDGFIWIGTKNGLNRFDGLQFKIYNKKNSNISSNDISDILIDSKERMWITTLGGGLNLYNQIEDNFIVYKNIPGNLSTISSNQLNTIFEDSKGKIWIGTENGLSLFDENTKTFKSFTHLNNDQNSISHNSVKSIYEDINGVLWIGTFGGGLNKFETNKSKFTHITPKTDVFIDFIHVISPLNNNEILIGTSGGGLLKFNIGENSFLNFFEGPLQQKQNINIVRAIKNDTKGNIWIGTDGNGIFKIEGINKDYPNVLNFLYNSQIKSSLSGNAVYDIIEDSESNVWIGTAWNGVNILSQENKYDFLHSDIRGVDPSPVLSIFKTDEELFFGLDGKGLTVYNTNDENVIYYNKEESKFIGGSYLQFVTQVRDGKFWIGTFANGLINFDPESGNYEQYKYAAENKTSLSYNDVRYVLEDESNNLWVATWGGGLCYFNKKEKEFKCYRENKNLLNAINSDNVISLENNGDGKIWLATFGGGIDLFDPVNEKFIHFQHDENNTNSISSNNIFSILKDSRGYLWIGTSGEGVNRYDIKNNVFERFDDNENIKYNTITAIIEDNNGVIWMSTKQGIISYDYNIGSFNTFPDLSEEFHINSVYKDEKGLLYFGSTNGVVRFDPNKISYESKQPEVKLTNFKLFNKNLNIGKDKTLSKNIVLEDHITLEHDLDVITFEFAALQFPSSANCEYSIKMENFDEDWRNIGKDRTATYTNLSPGDYTFQVRSKNTGRAWGDNYTSIDLKILKPFWLKWWAFIVYGLLFFTMVYLFRKYIIAWEQMKTKLKLEQLTHEKDTELYNLKQQFFTNISHEIRTPVTLILGSINRILESSNIVEKKQLNPVNTLKKSGAHLLQLVNELLDFRKLESNEIKLKVTQTNWVNFCEEIFLSFNELAIKKKINYTFKSSNNHINLWFDKKQMEKVIYNLLSNAFKFTKPEGVIQLKISTSNNFVQLDVSDSGIGISKKQIVNIFDRFYQSKSSDKVKEVGFGLGLSISKEIIKLHKGEILVDSLKNRGSTFSVKLLKGKEHFNPTEIIEDYIDEEQITNYIFDSEEQLLSKKNQGKQNKNIASNKELSILIVEDNQDILNYLLELLGSDFTVMKANNGEKALKLAITHIPDLIISDIMMPIMDGITLTRKLKLDTRTSHIPVVLLTARTSFIHKEEGYETGADEYITKPFNESLLKTRIKNILRNRQLLREKFNTEALTQPSELAINKVDQLFLEKLMKIIENNIDKNDLNSKFLTNELAMSHSVIYKKIKALTGLTFLDFVRDFKLKRAKQLIVNHHYSVAEACYKVGYSDRKYFSKLFKQKFGENPSYFTKK